MASGRGNRLANYELWCDFASKFSGTVHTVHYIEYKTKAFSLYYSKVYHSPLSKVGRIQKAYPH